MIFDSKENLLDEIAKDKSQIGVTHSTKLYTVRCLPSKKNCKLVYFNCCYCSAKIVCRVMEDGKLLVENINHKHMHTIAKFSSQIEE